MYDVLLHDVPTRGLHRADVGAEPLRRPGQPRPGRRRDRARAAFSRELKLRRRSATVRDDYDYVLIDCPPSLGLLTVNSLAAATEVLVPIQCEYYALEGLGQLLRNVGLVQKNLNPALEVSVIVCVMYDARTKLADQVVQEVRDHFGDKVCRTVIPRTVRLSEAPSYGQPISAFDPILPGRHRLPGAGQGGQRWWHGAAGWVGASRRSSRPRWRSARPPTDATTPRRSCRSGRSARTATSPGRTSTRSRWRR